MNNKQLFEQSARKILSKNQLEGVMRLHDALFEGQYEEQLADSVSDAVSDAVKYTVDEASDDAVEHAVDSATGDDDDMSDTPSIDVSTEDQERMAALLNDMSDSEKEIFIESLDEQQVQVLMEGFGWIKPLLKPFARYLTKNGRRAGRWKDFQRLTDKDVDLTNQWDQIMNINGPMSKRSLKEAGKLAKQRAKVEQKMNDLRVKAARNGGSEYETMENYALNKGSRNIGRETLDNIKNNLVNERDLGITKARDAFNRKKLQLNKQLNDPVNPITRGEYNTKVSEAIAKRDKAIAKLNAEYEAKVKPIDDKINMSVREGRYTAVNNGANAARPTAGTTAGSAARPFNIGGAAGRAAVGAAGRVGQLLRKIPSLSTIATGLVGAWTAFKLSLGAAAVGATAYGGYKLYDFFTKPEQIDESLGLEPGSSSDTLKKAIAVLGGTAAGYGAANLFGVESTAGKAVASLAGAAIASYFMFLNGGDEQKANQLLDEYQHADDADQRRINEVLQIDGLGQALQDLYNESHHQ